MRTFLAIVMFGVVLVAGILAIDYFGLPSDYCFYNIDPAGCREAMREKPPYERIALNRNALFASSQRFRSTRPFDWLITEGDLVAATATPPAEIAAAEDITILIHGFRGTDAKINSYFDEFIGLLSARGPKHPVLVYDWPSTARPYESLSAFERNRLKDLLSPRGAPRGSILGQQNGPPDPYRDEPSAATLLLAWESSEYSSDQKNARTHGVDGLIALVAELAAINPGMTINVVAHSMGCYVTEQTLRKKPELAGTVKNIVWLAPDVDSKTFGDAKFRAAVARLNRLAVFYSNDDAALNWPSRLANGGTRLGLTGVSDAKSLPANVSMFDETKALNEAIAKRAALANEAVHGVYLRQQSQVPDAVIDLLYGRANARTAREP